MPVSAERLVNIPTTRQFPLSADEGLLRWRGLPGNMGLGEVWIGEGEAPYASG
jgi:hypothetical protein